MGASAPAPSIIADHRLLKLETMADQLQVQLFLDQRMHTMSQWASATLLIFDVLLNLDNEIAFVWKSPWSLPKVLYIATRFFGLSNACIACAVATGPRSSMFCRIYNPLTTLGMLISSALADGLLLLRVTALFQHRKWFSLSMKALYHAIYGVEFAFLCYFVYTSITSSDDFDNSDNIGCVPAVVQSDGGANALSSIILTIATVPVLVFNGLLFFITLFLLFPSWSATETRTPLFTLFLRDGSIYFGMVTSVTAFAMVTPVVFTNRPGLTYISLPWFLAISPIAACRLLLDLRGMFQKPTFETTVRTASRAVFGVRATDPSVDTTSLTPTLVPQEEVEEWDSEEEEPTAIGFSGGPQYSPLDVNEV